MISKANSDPMIDALSKKDDNDLQNLYIKKVEFSTKNNQLASIKYIYSDGKQSATFGTKVASTFKVYEFIDDNIYSVGLFALENSVQQITFYDKRQKVLVKCGNIGDDNKLIKIPEGHKIVYAYGANSSDGKMVGMLGFTMWNC